MPVFIQCGTCGRKLRVRTDLVGKNVRCPGCRTKFLAQPVEGQSVPAGGGAPAAAAGTAEVPAPASSTQTADAAEELSPPPTLRRAAEAAEAMAAGRSSAGDSTIETGPASRGEEGPEGGEEPYQTSGVKVFVVLGLVLLLTAVLGVAGAWWITSAVKEALTRRAQQAVPAQGRMV